MSEIKPTVSELQAQLAELEAANAELSSQLDDGRPRTKERHPVRTIVAAVLIVLGTLLTPVAILGGWSKVALTDTETFVATYAPLAHDARVQAYITDQVVDTVEAKINVDGIIGDMVDGLTEVIKAPNAAAALEMLREPAVQGVHSALQQATSRVVTSDAFATVWEQSLRASHAGAISALRGDPDATVTITEEGLGLRLGPIVDQVRNSLVQEGFALASRIPAIDKTIVIAPSDQLMNAKVGYAIAVTLGTWLPIVALLLLVGGVLVAARRPLAALWAAIGLGFGALFVLAGISVGRTAATIAVPAALMPSDVVTLFYDTVIGSLSDIALATLTLAIVAGLTIWITGPFAHARQLRAFTTGIHESLNRWAADRGLSTGRFGLWLHAQRVWISALVAVLAALTLLASRPISVEEVLGTATVAIVVLLILGLLSRSPQESAPVEPAAGHVADQAQAG